MSGPSATLLKVPGWRTYKEHLKSNPVLTHTATSTLLWCVYWRTPREAERLYAAGSVRRKTHTQDPIRCTGPVFTHVTYRLIKKLSSCGRVEYMQCTSTRAPSDIYPANVRWWWLMMRRRCGAGFAGAWETCVRNA
jgi:hypothetical protein